MPSLTYIAIPLSLALLYAPLSGAQTTYRWVDKTTGQTVFSDKAPPPNASKVVTLNKGGTSTDDTQLPYATRQAAAKFPVTLYTSANCTELCAQARNLLNSRGTPFSEKMLKTEQEITALSALLGSEAAVPSLSVGQQSVKNYEPGAWNNLLDLAGYPKSAAYGSKASGAFSQ